MTPINYILTSGALTVFIDEDKTVSRSIAKESSRWEAALKALHGNNLEELLGIIDIKSALENYTSRSGDLVIEHGRLMYLGEELPDSLYIIQKIVDMAIEHQPLKPMLLFLEKLMLNPARRAVVELLGFLEYGNLPITPEGNFLAYKRVRTNYTDCHSGKFDNSIGKFVRMHRRDVDDDCTRTCSAGLHFCSMEYLKRFHGENIMVLAISPEDVVSIPNDYNNTKGRCCAYQVVGQVQGEPQENNIWGKALVDDYSDEGDFKTEVSD